MTAPQSDQLPRGRHDRFFIAALAVIGGCYVLLIVGMLGADGSYTTPEHLWDVLQSPEIRSSVKLSMISCLATAILSLYVAIPLGYLLSRFNFRGRLLLDVLLDIPIVLPPLVIGLSLLILFQTPPWRLVQDWMEEHLGFGITYDVPAVIIAQFAVSAAFAVRTMRITFDQISPRQEQVALTLGASRAQAFWRVTLPQAWRGILTAGTLAWARALGEFGPVLVFAGTTRHRTEVLPTSVYLELSVGHLESAVAVSLLMVMAALVVLLIVRVFGTERV
jgi:molybdate transport system permease protein